MDEQNGALDLEEDARRDLEGPRLPGPREAAWPIIRTSAQWDQIGAAMVAALAEMEPPKKSSTNPFYDSKYADLAECFSVSRPALLKHGIFPIFSASVVDYIPDEEVDDNGVPYRVVRARVASETRLMHPESGQWFSMLLLIDGRDTGPHAVGSTITYGKRYGYTCLVGLAGEDDDGNAGQRGHGGRGDPRKGAAPRTPAAAAPRKTAGEKAGGPTVDAAVEQGREALWAEMVSRCNGDIEAATRLLQECTSFEKPGQPPYPGTRNYRGIKSATALKIAWQRLEQHPTFGGPRDDDRPWPPEQDKGGTD